MSILKIYHEHTHYHIFVIIIREKKRFGGQNSKYYKFVNENSWTKICRCGFVDKVPMFPIILPFFF